MTQQLHLPGFPALSPRRRLWAEETSRLARLSSDQHARHRARLDEAEQRLNAAIVDLRHRLIDVERHVGVADIDRVPPPGPRLRAYRGR